MSTSKRVSQWLPFEAQLFQDHAADRIVCSVTFKGVPLAIAALWRETPFCIDVSKGTTHIDFRIDYICSLKLLEHTLAKAQIEFSQSAYAGRFGDKDDEITVDATKLGELCAKANKLLLKHDPTALERNIAANYGPRGIILDYHDLYGGVT